jgi:hypothetical protein
MANRSRSGHWRQNAAQSIDESAFLIDTEDWGHVDEFADAVEERAQLFGRSDVPAEDDDATGLNFFDQGARFGVEFSAGKTDK